MSTVRPALFAPGAPLWTDEHVSAGMLAAHLDPAHDAASRRPETIDREVSWIVSHLGLRPGARVLDLGCGPGLYCARLARLGHDVTGVDLSARSLRWAHESAERDGLAVDYVEADYVTLELDREFDAVLLVYLDLGTLVDADRDTLLAKVSAWLAPEGRFVFDVVSTSRQVAESHHEYDAANGFWRPWPHHVREETFVYPDEDVSVDQYTVGNPAGETVYRAWERRYTIDGLGLALDRAGLVLESIWSDLVGTPYEPHSETLGAVARCAVSPARGWSRPRS